jgi:proteasome lid subunit RPN8/RPN11
MGLFRSNSKSSQKAEWKITKKCLQLILEASKSSYPKEFGGLLRVDDQMKDTIVELVLLPGTISGDSHAIFRMHMKPIDFSIIGTVHSHPSPNVQPSQADLQLFQKSGKIHIITGQPYSFSSWAAYDRTGTRYQMKVV